MTLSIFTRRELLDQTVDAKQPAVLLEGSWSVDVPGRWSLDDAIDGRFDWIDRQAVALAARLGAYEPTSGADAAGTPSAVSPAYLHALALRYYLVKLIRVAAFFNDVRPLPGGQCVEAVAGSGDRDYVEVLQQLCASAGAELRVRWAQSPEARRVAFPRNATWRRWAERLSRACGPPMGRRDGPRIVLCGNPRLLDPVCRELLARRSAVWWLYDRFALRSWLRWQSTGTRQLVCDSDRGRQNRLGIDLPARLECCGVDLGGPVARWLHNRVAESGARHTRLLEQIDLHFGEVRPDALVLDEDATPMARAAVAMARRHGVRSLVVQHGVPCCRFGFAPLAADEILAWGQPSEETLLRWGVESERVRVTGAPVAEPPLLSDPPRKGALKTLAFRVSARSASPANGLAAGGTPDDRYARLRTPVSLMPPRILLLNTVPPRDDRPDAVSLCLNRRTYAEMLRAAFRTVAEIDDAELIVKLHPRAPEDAILWEIRAAFPKLRSRLVRRGPVERWLAGVDVVLSCGSSAGVEAALAGLPVIQLLPPGSRDILPAERWGMIGTAHDDAELRRLLTDVLIEGRVAATNAAFAATGATAAACIADAVLRRDTREKRSQPAGRHTPTVKPRMQHVEPASV